MDREGAAAGAKVTRRPADLLEEDETSSGAAAVRTDQAAIMNGVERFNHTFWIRISYFPRDRN
jgi:hypothetical protein